MSVHDGHRERLKEQFSEHGLGAMPDHNVLELLLFYAIPRGDVNPLAHDLVDRFGSLAAVFDAPVEELLSVPGVGENTARLIKCFLMELCRLEVRMCRSSVFIKRLMNVFRLYVTVAAGFCLLWIM